MSFELDIKQQGLISLWRYEYPDDIHYPNWHLTADEVGCLYLSRLIKAFETEQKECFCIVNITPPNDLILGVPNNQVGSAKWFSPTKWQINFSKNPNQWLFSANQSSKVDFTIGKNWFGEIKWAIDGIIVGEGDSWIGNSGGNEELLWYWGYPQTKK